MHIFNLVTLLNSVLIFSLISSPLMAVDLNKVHPSQIIGGPLERTMPRQPTLSERTRHVPYKYKHQRGMSLMQMYKGVLMKELLMLKSATIARVRGRTKGFFGAPYRKTSTQPKKQIQSLEDMIKSGDFELVIEKDGTRYLRRAKK